MTNSTLLEIKNFPVVLGVLETNESNVKFLSLEISVLYNEILNKFLYKSSLNSFDALILNEEFITNRLETYVKTLDSKRILTLLEDYDCKPSDLISNLYNSFVENREPYFNNYNNLSDILVPDGDGGLFEFCFETSKSIVDYTVDNLTELIISGELLDYLIDLNNGNGSELNELNESTLNNLHYILRQNVNNEENILNYLSKSINVYL